MSKVIDLDERRLRRLLDEGRRIDEGPIDLEQLFEHFHRLEAEFHRQQRVYPRSHQ